MLFSEEALLQQEQALAKWRNAIARRERREKQKRKRKGGMTVCYGIFCLL